MLPYRKVIITSNQLTTNNLKHLINMNHSDFWHYILVKKHKLNTISIPIDHNVLRPKSSVCFSSEIFSTNSNLFFKAILHKHIFFANFLVSFITDFILFISFFCPLVPIVYGILTFKNKWWTETLTLSNTT